MTTDPGSPAATSLCAHSDAIAGIVERLGSSTYCVLGRRHAVASAVLWRSGLVVTAAHPFRRTPAAVTLVGAGGEQRGAALVGVDSATDLALFRLADDGAEAAAAVVLEPAEGSVPPDVRPGHLAIAVGRSGEGDILASHGIVNRVGGGWQTWLGGQVDRLIRLDGGIYDGLSGGPVADASGAVLGIATAALARSYGIVVPAPTVTRVVDALLAGGRVARPWLGIGAQTVPLPAGDGAAGLLITALAGRGPAERAGLRIGDIVVAAAGHAAADLGALRRALTAHVGATVTVSMLRAGAPLDLPVEVAEWPASRRCC